VQNKRAKFIEGIDQQTVGRRNMEKKQVAKLNSNLTERWSYSKTQGIINNGKPQSLNDTFSFTKRQIKM
jgi:hypothetical protein